MRRSDTEMQQKIEELIQDEPEPRERARLLILYQIATVLIDNVAATRETTAEFRNHRIEYHKHVQREESYINQGKGMWRFAALILVVGQLVFGYLLFDLPTQVRKIEATVQLQGKDIDMLLDRARVTDRLGRQP